MKIIMVTGDGMIQEGELEDVLRACLQARATQNLLLTLHLYYDINIKI